MLGDLNAKSNYDGRVVPLDYMHFTLIGVMRKLGWRVIIIMGTVPCITCNNSFLCQLAFIQSQFTLMKINKQKKNTMMSDQKWILFP